MLRIFKPTFPLFAAVLLLAASIRPAMADVKVERLYRGPLPGVVGSTEIDETVYYSGLKRRSDPQTQVKTSKILLWGSAKQAQIIRLDRDLMWDVNFAKKIYAEHSVTPLKPGGQGDSASGQKEKPKEKIISSVFKVNKTGEKKTINGFPTEQYVLTWLVETENIESKQHTKILYTADLWNAGEDNPAIRALSQETSTFEHAYAKKMGQDATPEFYTQYGLGAMAAMLAETDLGTQAEMDKLRKELEKLQGYPIVMALKIETNQPDEGGVQGEKKEEPKGLMGKALGGLMKMVGEKKEEPKAGANGMRRVFESYFEVKSVDAKPLAADVFELPKDFKKVKEL